MSDTYEKNDGEESFAELFEQYSDGVHNDIQQGDRIEGQIISIGSSSVFVDTGTKSDGVVDKAALLDENGELPYSVGDMIELYVVSVNESEVILSKALSGSGSITVLQDAYASKTPVEGKVSDTCKGGFNIDVAGKRAFCPISQIDVKYVDKPEDYTGNTYQFLITRFEEKGRNIVVSRRDYLNIDIEKKKALFLESLSAGDIINGTITRLMPYGAFAELVSGVEGMIHISELSWSRLEKPEEAVNPGDIVKVKVLSVKDNDNGKSPKIALSVKQTSQDPWELAGDTIHPGEQLSGKVTRCAPFGAFVEIAPGTEGLVHISEMSYSKRILKAEDAVTVGDIVQVVVKDVDTGKKRISLSIRDAHGDPWNGIQMKYPVGKQFTGTVERKENFGLFVSLEPGITGLMPKSKINQSNEASDIEKIKPGGSVKVTVQEIDEEKRRLTLAPSGIERSDEWKSFSPSESSGMGTMGDLFKKAMTKKDK